ncbi:ABC transporter ATP-binding protein [Salidesulfovibrio onnuriiensis]|uniref:ABC transporter ATP-binding protein n=1 Tax=Salidesulfovibrio onnuriiensis TaxID=2583823 RepID=UPI0011CA5A72|nr:ABC transporter ATP-binding protein [Salidesulfovibrio onnuriiensis]
MMEPLISLKGVGRVYGAGENSVHALRDLDLDIAEGEFLAIMGTSGSGKSTTMNILGCLDSPTSGSYRFSGVEVTGLDRARKARLRQHWLGFVFQGFNLLGRTSAVENVELPLVYRRIGRRERRERAVEALRMVGLEGREAHTPAELSGGQMQRVAIARALVSEPLLLLADEPTGNLDSAMSKEIMQLLVRLNRERGITVVMVTHEPDMAEYASRTVTFCDGVLVSDSAQGGMS